MIGLLLAASALTATSLPERPYAEILNSGYAVSGDLIVENKGSEDEELVELRIDAFDAAGRLLQRKEINSNGTAPGIALIPNRMVKAGATSIIFNPAATFPFRRPPSRVDYVLTFQSGDEKQQVVTVTVRPKPAPPGLKRFPLRGIVLVWDGHDAASHHRRFDLQHPVFKEAGFKANSHRYAYDFIIVDRSGHRSTGDEKVDANWLSFGVPVYAVDSGTVVATRSELADNHEIDLADLPKPNGTGGNFVIIREADGGYSIFNHLKQGSVRVGVGQKVAAGQMIGQVGASGDSLFPHLHYQRMEGPTDRSEGAPSRFSGVRRPDGSSFANGYVDSGDIVIAN